MTDHYVPSLLPMGVDCSWCGSDHTDHPKGRPYRDKGGEPFCSKAHRDASTRALRRFLESDEH